MARACAHIRTRERACVYERTRVSEWEHMQRVHVRSLFVHCLSLSLSMPVCFSIYGCLCLYLSLFRLHSCARCLCLHIRAYILRLTHQDLLHICIMTLSHVWHDSFIRVIPRVHTCDVTHPCVWHDTITPVTWLIYTCHMTHLCTCTYHVIWVIRLCHFAHSYVWHDPFIYRTWPINMSLNRLYVKHDSVICAVSVNDIQAFHWEYYSMYSL